MHSQSYNLSSEQEIRKGLPTASRTQPIAPTLIFVLLSGSLGSAVHIPDQDTRLRLCVLNATCLPHDRADGGERADALLGVRPVEPHVGAVEEVRHRQLHEHVVEGNLGGKGMYVHSGRAL